MQTSAMAQNTPNTALGSFLAESSAATALRQPNILKTIFGYLVLDPENPASMAELLQLRLVNRSCEEIFDSPQTLLQIFANDPQALVSRWFKRTDLHSYTPYQDELKISVLPFLALAAAQTFEPQTSTGIEGEDKVVKLAVGMAYNAENELRPASWMSFKLFERLLKWFFNIGLQRLSSEQAREVLQEISRCVFRGGRADSAVFLLEQAHSTGSSEQKSWALAGSNEALHGRTLRLVQETLKYFSKKPDLFTYGAVGPRRNLPVVQHLISSLEYGDLQVNDICDTIFRHDGTKERGAADEVDFAPLLEVLLEKGLNPARVVLRACENNQGNVIRALIERNQNGALKVVGSPGHYRRLRGESEIWSPADLLENAASWGSFHVVDVLLDFHEKGLFGVVIGVQKALQALSAARYSNRENREYNLSRNFVPGYIRTRLSLLKHLERLGALQNHFSTVQQAFSRAFDERNTYEHLLDYAENDALVWALSKADIRKIETLLSDRSILETKLSQVFTAASLSGSVKLLQYLLENLPAVVEASWRQSENPRQKALELICKQVFQSSYLENDPLIEKRLALGRFILDQEEFLKFISPSDEQSKYAQHIMRWGFDRDWANLVDLIVEQRWVPSKMSFLPFSGAREPSYGGLLIKAIQEQAWEIAQRLLDYYFDQGRVDISPFDLERAQAGLVHQLSNFGLADDRPRKLWHRLAQRPGVRSALKLDQSVLAMDSI